MQRNVLLKASCRVCAGIGTQLRPSDGRQCRLIKITLANSALTDDLSF